jgi:hypothetical protein
VKLSRAETDIEFLKQEHEGVKFSLYKTDDDKKFISCFVARFPDAESCERQWEGITRNIALNYQVALTSEFSAWNIYLALISPVSLERSLKYRIENDRFALRKIVIAMSESGTTSSDKVVTLLENVILGADLEIGKVQQEVLPPPALSVIRASLSAGERIPMDNKEISIQARKAHLANLMAKVLGT